VQVLYDASAVFAVGTTEMGQGMISQMTQIIAEELGIPVERITALPTDTSVVPDSGPTVASRSTIMTGNAVLAAARKVKARLLEVAADLMGVGVEEVEVDEGIYKARGKSLKLKEILRECFLRRVPLAATGWFESPPTSWDEETGQGNPYITYAWAANVAEVEVDTQTGETRVVEFWAAHDVGKAFNPQQLKGQFIGGTLQGIGYALMEEILHKDGRMQNNRLSTYIIPTIKDAPKIHPIILEHPYSKGPYGAKGFAEQPLIGAAPAVVNAIFHATKRRVRVLPVTPERLFEALEEGGHED
jgi:CO/xanthine dehydrogenase Mo-binding subunit